MSKLAVSAESVFIVFLSRICLWLFIFYCLFELGIRKQKNLNVFYLSYYVELKMKLFKLVFRKIKF